jgi:hypothetical protein
MPASLSRLTWRRRTEPGILLWNSSAMCHPRTNADTTPSSAASTRPPVDAPTACGFTW